MTGYTVHVGTSEKYASNWDKIFGSDDQTTESRPAKTKQEKKKKSEKALKAKKKA